jgi:cellulose synthase/poly-beta-1,6-N-acetylglucosamine synthase-like glycosyltransferase
MERKMMWLWLIPIMIYVGYWWLMDRYFHSNESLGVFSDNEFFKCSIVICAFNEERNIEKCLNSILLQKEIQNVVEIIVIDDGSQDFTYEKAKSILEKSKLPFQLIKNDVRLGKKRSIEKALQLSCPESDWVILRDADTYTLSDEWWIELQKSLKKNTDLVIAPVITEYHKGNWISYLQYFEGLALMHLTYASAKMHKPILGSAANLVFKKKRFLKLQPYKDNIHLNTGDDIFLIQKVKKAKGKITAHFHPNAVVYTYAPCSVKALIQQKSRWLSKTQYVKDSFNSLSALIIGGTNIFFIPMFLCSFKMALISLILKTLIDFKILISVQKKLNLKPFSYVYFFIGELVYILYVCALIFKFLFSIQRK